MSFVFFIATIFVAHIEIFQRYSNPQFIAFAIIAFNDFLKKRIQNINLDFASAIYLYSINFISHNTAPVADWTPYN